MNNQSSFYKQLQRDCEDIATQAVDLLRSHHKKFTVVQMKDEVDLATSADIASERLIISLIREKYPGHSIWSEEAGTVGGESDYVWIVDPLDGSKEFARGLKDYNVLLAVEEKYQLVAASMCCNGENELYSCSYGNGAILDGEKILVNHLAELDKSLVGFHLPIRTAPEESVERSLLTLRGIIYSTYRVRPTWYDANFMGWVARGALEAHIVPPDVKSDWDDNAAGILLVEEAGGKVTDWEGNPLKNHDISKGILASNGKLHKQLLALLQTA